MAFLQNKKQGLLRTVAEKSLPVVICPFETLFHNLLTISDIDSLLHRLTLQLHAVDGIIIIICHFSMVSSRMNSMP